MYRPVFASVAAVVVLAVASGADTPTEGPTRLPEFFVSGERVGALEVTVPQRDLRAPAANPGQDLLAIPGVYGHARAADAMEPSIRGLGLDRVATTLNGIPLVNASPERTNSPVVILGPSAVTGIVVTKALPSVTLGPVTTGGRIALETGGTGAQATAPFSAELTTSYDGARDGIATRGRVAGHSGALAANATFFAQRLGDYTSADGRQVAARLSEHGGSAGLEWRGTQNVAKAEFIHRRLELQETISLPLDGKNTDAEAMTFSHRWSNPATAALQAVEWRAGYAYTDPYITSELRPVAALSFAQATSRSFGAGMNLLWRMGTWGRLATGVDYSRQTRRAVRTTPAGKDYIWPGATYEDAGLFAEWTHAVSTALRLRVGARVDDVRSDASDADFPALGRPVRVQYATYNGPGAATVARHDQVAATNILAEWKQGAASAFAGIGYSVQPAPITERYRAFLNALGGDGRGGNAVELGNPALSSEGKLAFEAGGTIRGDWVNLEATVYHYRVDDFILRKPIGITEPPLARMVVFGYRNVNADFTGAEVGATLKPAPRWTVPVTLAVAQGRNRDTGTGLSEIPPREVTVAVRRSGGTTQRPWAVEVGGRIVAAKTNPAPLDNPLFANAGGFSVWHIRAGVPLGNHIKLQTGIENLLDRSYSEYLSPPVAPFRPASGNLAPGDRVPLPGRAAWVAVTVNW